MKKTQLKGVEFCSAINTKVPDALADRLSADIRRIIQSPEFVDALAAQGMTPVASSRAAAANTLPPKSSAGTV